MNLEDYIVVTDQLLSDTALDEIKSLLADVSWQPALNYGDIQNFRTCSVFPIMKSHYRHIDNMLFEAVNAGGQFYKSKFLEFHFRTDSGYEILRYEKGQFYKKHTDHFEGAPRLLAFSLGLNNDYEGGEFSFFDSLDLKVQAGHAIMFPANFMYPHEIKPVTAGTRYSMITWFL